MLKRNLAKPTETNIKCNKATNEPSFPLQPFPFSEEKKWKSNLLHVSLSMFHCCFDSPASGFSSWGNQPIHGGLE